MEFEETGGTFLVSDIEGYFNNIVKAIFYGEGSFSFLFQDKTNTMITLMISTTLLPTLIHFAFVFIVTIWAVTANSMKLIGLFFVGNGKFFSLVMSTISLLFLMGIFSLFFNSLAGDKSDKGKDSDSNNTTLSKQVETKD